MAGSSSYQGLRTSERLHGGSLGAEGSHGGSLGTGGSYGSSMSSMSSYSASRGSEGFYDASMGHDGSFDGLLTEEESHRRSTDSSRSYSSSFTGSLDYNELALRVSESLQSEWSTCLSCPSLPPPTAPKPLCPVSRCWLPSPFLLPTALPYTFLPLHPSTVSPELLSNVVFNFSGQGILQDLMSYTAQGPAGPPGPPGPPGISRVFAAYGNVTEDLTDFFRSKRHIDWISGSCI